MTEPFVKRDLAKLLLGKRGSIVAVRLRPSQITMMRSVGCREALQILGSPSEPYEHPIQYLAGKKGRLGQQRHPRLLAWEVFRGRKKVTEKLYRRYCIGRLEQRL
jgi:hypothetical protein